MKYTWYCHRNINPSFLQKYIICYHFSMNDAIFVTYTSMTYINIKCLTLNMKHLKTSITIKKIKPL